MNTKIILGLGLIAASSIASADPFYANIGTDYHVGGAGKVNATSTSIKDEVIYIYQSQSLVTDVDGSGDISAGDTITTNGGYNQGGPTYGAIGNNQITGFNPNQSIGGDSNNGYGTNWQMTFDFTGLSGVIVAADIPNGVLEIAYGAAGNFNLYVTEDGISYRNFMDIAVTGAATGSGGTLLTGQADFTAVDSGLTLGGTSINDILHSGNNDCLGDDSFQAISGCTPSMEISFLADFNTNVANISIIDNGNGTFGLFGNHDGSAVFNSVPEPSLLALMGVSLVSFGFTSRRKKA